MNTNMELTIEDFKGMIKDKFSGNFPNIIDESRFVLKVILSEELYLKIDFENAWKTYEITNNKSVLFKFVSTQAEALQLMKNGSNSYEEVKPFLIPTVRSDEYLEKLKSEDFIVKEKLGKDLNMVVVTDHEKFTQIVDRNLYDYLPSDGEVIKDAIQNIIEKGWIEETKIYTEDLFDLYIFEEKCHHSTHYQFYLTDWLDKSFGDCYFAFPTNKIAMVLKLKTNYWKDWINALNFFERAVKSTYETNSYSLSNTIVKYEKGKFEYL